MWYCCTVYAGALTDLVDLTLQVELPIVVGLISFCAHWNESIHPGTKLSFFGMFTAWKALK